MRVDCLGFFFFFIEGSLVCAPRLFRVRAGGWKERTYLPAKEERL